MLKDRNKRRRRKRIKSKILMLLIALCIAIGIYINFRNNHTEDITITSIAVDNLGQNKTEQIELIGRKIETGLYEIELPKTVNDNPITEIKNVVLVGKQDIREKVDVEVVDNKIQLTQDQIDNYTLNYGISVQAMVPNNDYGGGSVKYPANTILRYSLDGGTTWSDWKATTQTEYTMTLELPLGVGYVLTQARSAQSGDGICYQKNEGQWNVHEEKDPGTMEKLILDDDEDSATWTITTTRGGGAYHGNGWYAWMVTVVRPEAPVITTTPTSLEKWTNSGTSIKITVDKTVTGAEQKYCLLPSSTSLNGATWKDYTSGTAFTVDPDSGEYYLFVKRIARSTSNGTDITIDGTVYHRYGPYRFDKTNPTAGTLTMKLGSASGNNYTNDSWTNQSVYISLNNGTDLESGHKSTKYTITKNGTAYSSNQTTAQTLTQEGVYTIVVTTTDNAGNTAQNTYTVKIDKRTPSIAVSPTSCVWRNSALNLTITVQNPSTSGGDSGLSANNSYQYYLSTSETILSGGTWTDYTSGSQISLRPERTGTYYLFVRRVKDNAGNISSSTGEDTEISGVVYHKYGSYQFDFTPPTLGILSMKKASITGKDYISGTMTSENIFVYVNNGTDAHSGHKKTTYSINGGDEKGVGTANATQITADGTYTIIVTTTDNAGNVSRSETYKVIKNVKDATIGLGQGTIKPIYRPEWTKVSSTINTTNKTLTVTVKAMSYKSQQINSNVGINYASDVESTLTAEDVKVFINGVEVTSTTNPTVGVSQATTSTDGTSGKKVKTHVITLSNLEEASRQAGLPYKELSGNIKLKIGGRGQKIDSYDANVATDEFGNQNMMETDENGTNADGTWIDIGIEDDMETDHNQQGNLFVDFIKPEFTYEASSTVIGNGFNGNTKIVTVAFDVTDKYFKETSLATDPNANLVTVKVANTEVNTTVNITKRLSKVNDVIINTTTNETSYKEVGYTLQENEKKVGERYELVIEGLEILDENGLSNGYTYSGPMSLSFNSGIITDLSSNQNAATTITIGVDEIDGNPNTSIDSNGEKVDVVDPIWILGDVSLDTGTIKLIAKDKYFNDCTINNNSIKIYTNGVESTTIRKDIESVSATEIYETVDGVRALVGKEYTLKISNITSIDGDNSGTYVPFVPSNLESDSLNNAAGFKYKTDNGGNITIKIAEATISDTSGNTSREQTMEVGMIDSTTLEVYDVQKIQDAEANTETFIFNVTDRNYDPTDLIETNEITLTVDGDEVSGITKTISSKPIKAEIDGTTKTLGHQYTLVLSNVAESTKQTGKSYLEWSGTFKIKIANDAATDLKGNHINPSTTTLTDFVDFIKPEMQVVTVANPIDTASKTYTASFTVIDKYLDTPNTELMSSRIKVYVDGEQAIGVSKYITSRPITATFNKTVDGEVVNGTYTIGYTYTLILSNFEQIAKFEGKDYFEWSGTVSIELLPNIVNDTSGNTLDSDTSKRTINGQHVDFIKPVIEKVTSSLDKTSKVDTVIFNVMDKYLDTSKELAASDISIYVDNELVTVLTKNLTKVQDIKATVNGNTEHVVGQQYKLEISNFEQSSRNSNDYKDYSGSVKIEIAQNAMKDTSNNTFASETNKRSMYTDFVDVSKPDLEYTYQSSDINKGTKSYTMTFDVTDKYYISGEITLADLTILMKNGQKDSSGNQIIYNLKNEPVTISLRKVDKTATFNKTVENPDEAGTYIISEGTYTIGHEYTLTISNLEHLEIKDGHNTADYSGIITVAVAGDKIKDEEDNGNTATTITSGVNIPGGSVSDDAVAVDVVRPIFTKVSSSAYSIDPNNKASSIAIIMFRGTDTYFKTNTLALSDIKVVVDGTEVTSGITRNLVLKRDLTEDRIINGTNTTGIKYGEEWTVTIRGFAQTANQVKIRIPAGVLTDEAGNTNDQTDFIVYNVLKSTKSETGATAIFLGNTNIQRQNVEKVVFASSLAEINTNKSWDVSAQQDGSIMAWYNETSAPYTVYIGSNDEIFANRNSARLFAYIGYADVCTATETITNLNLLNVRSVVSMNYMFSYTGFTAMTSLDLGDKFDTSNVLQMAYMFQAAGYKSMTDFNLRDKFDTSKVTNMAYMLADVGYTAMTNLDLGDKFDTSKVVDMQIMFYNTGYTAMTSLNLGDKFDTSKVTNMDRMFYNTGRIAMTSLNLGDKFDTSKVTNMRWMFAFTGRMAMTSLNLGDKFDTSNVTNMEYMFYFTGYTAMTSLDLGNKFDTSKVTIMTDMFYATGWKLMTLLDLGPAFTKIAETNTNMFKYTGKSGCIINAPESIYKNKNAFKLNSSDTTDTSTDLQYTTGTIFPVYKPEWEKSSAVLDETNKTLTINVKGKAYKKPTVNYASNVTSTLKASNIKVFANGVEVTSTTNPKVTVDAGTTVTNSTTGKTEITYKVVLSNLEETARRANLPYKELSGNISLKIAGRGEATSTYTANVLKDEYGNQSMMESDEGQALTWVNKLIKDANTTHNTAGIMFADFIKPEFTYRASETVIGNGNNGNTKKVTILFDVVDKYFSTTDLATDTLASLITVKVANTEVNTTVNVNKTLTRKNDIAINNTTNAVTYKTVGATLGSTETKIGERYELVIDGLEILDANGLSNGYTYSGLMNLAFPSSIVTDLSSNKNAATTITIGVDENDGNANTTTPSGGEIVDVVSPVWELGETSLTDYGTIKLRAIDKYFDKCTISEDKIKVIVNGVESDKVEKEIEIVSAEDILGIVDGVANKVVGKEYTLKLLNITLSGSEYITFTPLEPIVGGDAKYRAENGGQIEIEIEAGTITDKSLNTSRTQRFQIGNIDATKPEIYDVQKTQNATANTETFIFNVTDRNYDPTDLIETSEISIFVDGEEVTSITKSITSKEIKASIDGTTKVLGHQYTLVLSNIAESTKQTGKSYLEWSGTLQVKIAENAARDLNGNTLNEDTTTISDFVDYIKPEMQEVTVANPINTASKTYTASFSIIDKYFDTTNALTKDEIKVYIDGEEATSITKTLTSTAITAKFNKTVDGVIKNGTYTIGYTYTLVLSGFEQTTKQTGKDFMEWSGTVKIEVLQNAVSDTTGNTLDSDASKRTINGKHVDFIKPVIERVSATSDSTAKTETITFNVMDKYLDTTKALSASEITLYIDNELVTAVTKTLTKVQDFTYTVNGDSGHVVGQQYKLVLSNFEQSSRNSKDYKDYSGTVKIQIAQNAMKDTSSNTLATETAKRTVNGEFVDFIKPDLEYIHQSSDVNKGTKTYTMTFDITDKYYKTGEITLNDLTILMKNGQKDSSGNEIIYNLKNEPVTISLSKENKTATFNKTVSGTVTSGTYVIGHTYTLTISNLEHLEIKDGHTTADYSGIVTVAVAGNKIQDDKTNGNTATTITSGVNIPGGTLPDDATIIDVVRPIFTKISSSASTAEVSTSTGYVTDSTATITFKGTDTYFKANTLTLNNIKVIVDGVEKTSGITRTLDLKRNLTEDRIINGTNTTGIKYGEEWTISIKGFSIGTKQVKIRIPAGVLTDEAGNTNATTEFILYNVLKSTSDEYGGGTAAFLGNTNIQRQNIEKVIFTSSLSEINTNKSWDVSAIQDGSIMAWYNETSAPYTVYIGSDDEIFANTNSSRLFSYIGYANTCKATETIKNLNLLNVDSVASMDYMFMQTGYAAMTSLDLGDKFNTSNVTRMESMFYSTGYMAMTSLNLGDKFDTSKVTAMNEMFYQTGYTAMTSLDLGNKFNTSKVTIMADMFSETGHTAMTTLNLGDKFDTSNVTDMTRMFDQTGYTAMTSLSLGEKFNTSKVTSMYWMFGDTGANAMISLDLGDKFDTSNVTNMYCMFLNTGYKAMTSLDLGNKFNTSKVTIMTSMFFRTGYTAMTSLDLGDKFDTSNVENMAEMFGGTGYTAMTTLNLGDKFDTSNVTNMSNMFMNTGYKAMTSLYLGDKFDTSNVTNMKNMFYGTGSTSMTLLDLGPAFTNIAETNTNMFKDTGKSGVIIRAPEAIYSNQKVFKYFN